MEYSKPKKIFIVDDDVMLTEALSDYLTRDVAHEISCFHTGEECLKYLTGNPDIVILDYYLNSVHKDAANGMEILEVIKKNYPNIHVVMLSSQEHYGVAMKTLIKGAEQYVPKDEDAFETIAEIIRTTNAS
jgi:DNA-binding NarL/FixJ family response regulator